MADPGGPVLLAIFGAGASYDCLPVTPATNVVLAPPDGWELTHQPHGSVKPPLTQHLVRPDEFAATILRRYESALPVVDAVRRRLAEADGSATVSLERALAEYQERAAQDPEGNRHLAAMRFYVRDLLWACSEFMRSSSVGGGLTNHVGLVRDLHTWATVREGSVCLTSFNYDYILEAACRVVWGFKPWSFDSYVSHARMQLLKPHGSVLWQWTIPGLDVSGSLHDVALASIDRAAEPLPPPEKLDPAPYSPFSTEAKGQYTRTMSLPALALPVDGKAELIWPREQAEVFDSVQGRVSKLLIIGWRAVEEHFLSRMSRLATGAKAVIVTGGPNAEAEAREIESRLSGLVIDNTTAVAIATEGFTGFMRSDLLRWLLDDS